MDLGLLNVFSISKTAVGAVFVYDQYRTNDLTVVGCVLWSIELGG